MARYTTEDEAGPDRSPHHTRRPSTSERIKAFFTKSMRSKSRVDESARLTKAQKVSRDAPQVKYLDEHVARTFPTDNRRQRYRQENQEQRGLASRPQTGNIPLSNRNRGRGNFLNIDPYASNASDVRSTSLPPPPPPKDYKIMAANAAVPKSDNPYAKRLRAQREEIREGRTERDPRRLEPVPKLSKQNELPEPKTAHKRTSSSGSGKWSEYLMDGADRLDASFVGFSSSLTAQSKKLTAKFHSPANSRDVDSDDDKSFYCIGESRPAKYESAGRRPTRDVVPPLTTRVNETCRLCGSSPLDKLRVICQNCESQCPSRDFVHPRDVENANVIKPTTPLKDQKNNTEIPRKPIPSSLYADDAIPKPRSGNVARSPVVVTQTTHVAQQAVWSTTSQSSRGRPAEVGAKIREQMSSRYTPNDRDSVFLTPEEADAILHSRHPVQPLQPLKNRESKFLNPEQAAHALRFGLRSPSPVQPRADRDNEQYDPVSPASSFVSGHGHQNWQTPTQRADFRGYQGRD